MTLATRNLRLVVNAAVVVLPLVAGTLVATPSVAARPNGYTITNVNQRAGPGTDYPVIVTVHSSAPISILGCLGNYAWCDVLYQGRRGWMRSIYLQGFYQGGYYALRDYAPQMGFPVVSFDIDAYWGSNYRSRPFYAEKAKWGAPRGEGWANTADFYSPLERYGDWVWLQGQYVWVPTNVDRHWRPYTVGRWVFTRRYGWMWASSEPFGWATYHYGRWGFSNRVGWFWVPGNRWGPAWVSWRSSDDYLAWAPLPPAYDESASLNVNVGNVPDYYWQVVPSASFLSVNVSRDVVRDKRRFTPILEETRPLGNVTINNNVVVNNVVNVTYVEEKTKEKVVVKEVAVTKDSSEAGKVEGSAVEIFQPPVDQPPASEAPRKVKKIGDVAKDSQTKEQAGGQPTTEELLLPPEVKPAAGAPPAAESIEQASPEPGPPAGPTGEAAPPAAEKPAAEKPAAERPSQQQIKAPPSAGTTGAPPEEMAAPKAADEAPPVSGPATPPEPAPPSPAEETAAPKAKEEGGAPPESTPPPPPAGDEEAPPQKERKPKAKKVLPEQVQPMPPPAPVEEAAPPKPKQISPEEIEPRAPPMPSLEEGAQPQPKSQGGQAKPKKEAPPPPAAEQEPSPPEEGPPPPAKGQPAPCPEGTVLQDGTCVLPPE